MINKEKCLKILKTKYQDLDALKKMQEQLNNYFLAMKNYTLEKNNYQINDKVDGV